MLRVDGCTVAFTASKNQLRAGYFAGFRTWGVNQPLGSPPFVRGRTALTFGGVVGSQNWGCWAGDRRVCNITGCERRQSLYRMSARCSRRW